MLPADGLAICTIFTIICLGAAVAIDPFPWSVSQLFLRVLVPFCVALVLLMIARQVYYRSGTGTRVAVSFSSYRVAADELSRTRSLIKKYFSRDELSHNISIRICNFAEGDESKANAWLENISLAICFSFRFRLKTMIYASM